MDEILPQPCLPDLDPALIIDWDNDAETKIINSDTLSDELEAFYQVQEETKLEKSKQGTVIQQRAWGVEDVFRSDSDSMTDTPLRARGPDELETHISPPSSPPSLKMPSVSAPLSYPITSSPPPNSTSPKFTKARARKSDHLLAKLSEQDEGQLAPERRMLDESDLDDSNPRQESPTDLAVKQPTRNGTLPKPKTKGGFILGEDMDDKDEPMNLDKYGSFTSKVPSLQHSTTADGPSNEHSMMLDSLLDRHGIFPDRYPPASNETYPLPPILPSFLDSTTTSKQDVITCSGRTRSIRQRKKTAAVPFEQMVAARSTTKAGRAKRSYYGIDIHQVIDDAAKEISKKSSPETQPQPDLLPTIEQPPKGRRRTLMWTEKYRARNFMELVGDDRTHRQVLRWLKAWDPIVFPKAGKGKSSKRPRGDAGDEKPHRKILLLTGPPGLGKTTLAHVCARQAGYEVMEINASDDRSKDVVKGRIRTSVGTESVKTGSTRTTKAGVVQSVAHPLCVVVDEVDGVVGGSGASGEGGFIKALIDLIQLDQKNSSGASSDTSYARKKKRGDNFRLMRPLILICNDIYHPSLRSLRHSSFAEVIHIRKPPLDAVATRMKSIFEKEGVSCDNDAARRLCEATWGLVGLDAKKKTEGSGEGDIRSVMVVGEWAAGKLKSSTSTGRPKLTRKWVEQNMLTDLSHGGDGSRGIGRGGVKEVVNRIFLEGAGFPRAPALTHSSSSSTISNIAELPTTHLHHTDRLRAFALSSLTTLIETTSETERILTEIFSLYPSQPYNDDTSLSKPDSCYEWLHFHDSLSSKVFHEQEWELAPYLSQPVLACHLLFASPARHHFTSSEYQNKTDDEEEGKEPLPFSTLRADFEAHEALKANRAMMLEVQGNLNAVLLRSFRSPEEKAMELVPYVVRMLSPDVKPVVVGGNGEQRGIASVRREGEKKMVERAVDVMLGLGVKFERGKLEGSEFGRCAPVQRVYRMEPPLDVLTTFLTSTSTSSESNPQPTRYATRQVLDQEYQKSILLRENAARQARFRAGSDPSLSVSSPNALPDFASTDKENQIEVKTAVKRDFFGRSILPSPFGMIAEEGVLQEVDGNAVGGGGKRRRTGEGIGKEGKERGKGEVRVWVSYHEGFSNAVKKPLSVQELLRGL